MDQSPAIYRLAEAIKKFFPNGGITKSSLRNEARAGRLEIIRIANKDFVTEEAIRAMLEKCVWQEKSNHHGSICATEVKKAEHQPGSSVMERGLLAQAALLRTLQEPNAPSKTTLPKNSSRQEQVAQNSSVSPKS
ncbi:MAG: hypothetical protein P8Y67_13520 [Alphaproteobacteria bacterium]